MIFKYNDKEYNLHFGFKAMIIYEKITKKSFIPDSMESMIIAFYSAFLAADSTFNTSFTDFCNWLDENPDELTKFLNDIIEQANARTNTINATEEEVKEGEEVSKND